MTRPADHQPPQVLLRKHSKQSLSQPTIPEEGPEHLLAESEDQPQQVMVVPPSSTVSKGLQQGPVPIAKNLAKELCASGGAISKRATPSLPSGRSIKTIICISESQLTRFLNANHIHMPTMGKKSSSDCILLVKSTPQAAPAVTASEPTMQKSPKTSHKTHESTVQRITKAIRGSGRSDSKSKKKDGREARYGHKQNSHSFYFEYVVTRMIDLLGGQIKNHQ